MDPAKSVRDSPHGLMATEWFDTIVIDRCSRYHANTFSKQAPSRSLSLILNCFRSFSHLGHHHPMCPLHPTIGEPTLVECIMSMMISSSKLQKEILEKSFWLYNRNICHKRSSRVPSGNWDRLKAQVGFKRARNCAQVSGRAQQHYYFRRLKTWSFGDLHAAWLHSSGALSLRSPLASRCVALVPARSSHTQFGFMSSTLAYPQYHFSPSSEGPSRAFCLICGAFGVWISHNYPTKAKQQSYAINATRHYASQRTKCREAQEAKRAEAKKSQKQGNYKSQEATKAFSSQEAQPHKPQEFPSSFLSSFLPSTEVAKQI